MGIPMVGRWVSSLVLVRVVTMDAYEVECLASIAVGDLVGAKVVLMVVGKVGKLDYYQVDCWVS